MHIFLLSLITVYHTFEFLVTFSKFVSYNIASMGFFLFFLAFTFTFYFIFWLYDIVLVLPYINMTPPQVYTCSLSWTLLPPHTITLGHPSAPAPSIQYRESNLDWRLVSYMILYMFQCHSPKSSTLSLSHRVQKTVLYICVSFAVSHTGLSLLSF